LGFEDRKDTGKSIRFTENLQASPPALLISHLPGRLPAWSAGVHLHMVVIEMHGHPNRHHICMCMHRHADSRTAWDSTAQHGTARMHGWHRPSRRPKKDAASEVTRRVLSIGRMHHAMRQADEHLPAPLTAALRRRRHRGFAAACSFINLTSTNLHTANRSRLIIDRSIGAQIPPLSPLFSVLSLSSLLPFPRGEIRAQARRWCAACRPQHQFDMIQTANHLALPDLLGNMGPLSPLAKARRLRRKTPSQTALRAVGEAAYRSRTHGVVREPAGRSPESGDSNVLSQFL